MSRGIRFTPHAWEDYLYWIDQDRKTLKRLNKLITECTRTPFGGSGKPEALSENLSGFWSRRIDDTNRLVYAVTNESIDIIQCKGHY